MRCSQRQTGLADAAHTGQRHQRPRDQQPIKIPQLVVATYQAGALVRQVPSGLQASQQRNVDNVETVGVESKQALRPLQPAQPMLTQIARACPRLPSDQRRRCRRHDDLTAAPNIADTRCTVHRLTEIVAAALFRRAGVQTDPHRETHLIRPWLNSQPLLSSHSR